MQDLNDLAIEAVRYRQERSPLFAQIIQEMEACGLSPSAITRRLEKAETTLSPITSTTAETTPA